jgi:hypothetical protein
MKKLFLFLVLHGGPIVFAQETVLVEKIVFTETVDKAYTSAIPHVTDQSGRQNQITRKINDAIQERFMLESFDPKTVTEFRWYDVEFEHQVKESVLHIAFRGEYYGAYPNQIEESLYFDLKTGTQLAEKRLPFHALFSPEGYFDFLNKYWLSGCSGAYQEAIRCADAEPYCDCYDIEYGYGSGKLNLSITNDCFPHVVRACTPDFTAALPLDTVKPFLSNFGKYVLLEAHYAQMSRLDQFLFYREQLHKIPNYCYAVGSIDHKYPFGMALQLTGNGANTVTGYYFYEKKKIKIPLSGTVNGRQVAFTEQVGGKITGRFELTWHDAYQQEGIAVGEKYLTGTWTNALNGKTVKISFLNFRQNK